MALEIHEAALEHEIKTVNSKLIILVCPICGWVYVMGYNASGRVSQVICPADSDTKHTLKDMGKVTIITEKDQRQMFNDLLDGVDLGGLDD